MIYNVLTLYTDLIDEYSRTGVIGRGVAAGALMINTFNIRDYTLDKHGCVDDYPYSGGAGMVMMVQPVEYAVNAAKAGREDIPVIYFTPQGKVFDSAMAKKYAEAEELILLCGHFEGIDQRAVDMCVTEEISMGDYIVTGGHIAAMCFMDSVSRYVPGVLGNNESVGDESFENGLLEYPQYTRPYEYKGMKVPDVLLSGNRAVIERYKREEAVRVTMEKRPDLLDKQS